MEKKHLIGYPATGFIALLIGVGAGGAGDATTATAGATGATTTVTAAPSSGSADTVTTTATTTKTARKTVTKAPKPKASFPGDGTYEVGVDIKAGTYVSKTPSSGNCYWGRLSGSDGFDNIIANNNTAGQSVVTIRSSDKFFESSGCSEWARR